jgi:hypothetical protein
MQTRKKPKMTAAASDRSYSANPALKKNVDAIPTVAPITADYSDDEGPQPLYIVSRHPVL